MYIQTNIHTPTYAQLHAYVHTYVHTYIRTNVHTYIHTYTHCVHTVRTDRQTDRQMCACIHYILFRTVALHSIAFRSTDTGSSMGLSRAKETGSTIQALHASRYILYVHVCTSYTHLADKYQRTST